MYQLSALEKNLVQQVYLELNLPTNIKMKEEILLDTMKKYKLLVAI